jgi:hypothetical protein
MAPTRQLSVHGVRLSVSHRLWGRYGIDEVGKYEGRKGGGSRRRRNLCQSKERREKGKVRERRKASAGKRKPNGKLGPFMRFRERKSHERPSGVYAQ